MSHSAFRRRALPGVAAVVATGLAASALTLGLSTAQAVDAVPVVSNHGAAGVADAYAGLTAAPNGGTYNVGYQVVSGTNRAVLVTRSLPDGSLDTSFGADGTGRVVLDLTKVFHESVTNPGAKEGAKGVAVDKLGRILVVGETEGVQGDAATATDTDLFIARLHPNGALDTSYGTGGWTRINLSDGKAPAGSTGNGVVDLVGSNGVDVFLRPNGRVVFSAGLGTDTNATRTARDVAAVQVLPSGQLDPDFGVNGVATHRTPQSDNVRRGLLDADGSYYVTAYASVGNGNQPFITKFTPTGQVDTAWGEDGVATAYAGGSGGMAEAYGITKASDGSFVVSGYGYRAGRTGAAATNGVDAILFSLDSTGGLNTGWAQNGFQEYHVGADGNSSADRHRNHLQLADDRVIGVGQTAITSAATGDALITLTNADGSRGTATTVDLGGTDDALWGVTSIGDNTYVAAGFGNGDATLVTFVVAPLPAPTQPTTPPTTPPTTAPVVKVASKLTLKAPAAIKASARGTVTVTVKAGVKPTGKVKVTVAGKSLSATLANGVAKLKLPKLRVGRYTVKATYTGSAKVKASIASTKIRVVR